MNNRIDFDIFDFCLMVESCIPPTSDRRIEVWKRVIDDYYHKLTKRERGQLYGFICANEIYKYGVETGNEMCLLFQARFTTESVEVVTMINGVQEVCDAIYSNGFYYYSSNRKINPGFVIEVREKSNN